ncbi:hypothetical protein EDB86DRAFT_3166243 [Lactarius hatsudake]|nr:hypothetical protein EDB86DRAFT_3166243 [Lactarius hatsudake]
MSPAHTDETKIKQDERVRGSQLCVTSTDLEEPGYKARRYVLICEESSTMCEDSENGADDRQMSWETTRALLNRWYSHRTSEYGIGHIKGHIGKKIPGRIARFCLGVERGIKARIGNLIGTSGLCRLPSSDKNGRPQTGIWPDALNEENVFSCAHRSRMNVIWIQGVGLGANETTDMFRSRERQWEPGRQRVRSMSRETDHSANTLRLIGSYAKKAEAMAVVSSFFHHNHEGGY